MEIQIARRRFLAYRFDELAELIDSHEGGKVRIEVSMAYVHIELCSGNLSDLAKALEAMGVDLNVQEDL